MHPTYYVRHPDDTYSVVAPQPAEVLVDAAITTLNQLGRMAGNSEHENNRIRAALTAAFSEADALATPADAGAGPATKAQLTNERILRLGEESAINYVTDERRPDNATIIDFARSIEREVIDNHAGPTGQVRQWNMPEAGEPYDVPMTFSAPADVKLTGDQWIFDLAAKHESRGKELFGPITFSSTAIVDFTRDVEREVLARLSTPGAPVTASQPARQKSNAELFTREEWEELDQSPAPVTAEPVAWAIFADNGNLRIWSHKFEEVQRMADREGKSLVGLYAAPVAAPAPADRDAIRDQALYSAAQAVMREALDCAYVHPCDYHDDDARARTLTTEMQELYRALKSMERAAPPTCQPSDAICQPGYQISAGSANIEIAYRNSEGSLFELAVTTSIEDAQGVMRQALDATHRYKGFAASPTAADEQGMERAADAEETETITVTNTKTGQSLDWKVPKSSIEKAQRAAESVERAADAAETRDAKGGDYE